MSTHYFGELLNSLSPELEAVGSGLVSSTNIGIERALHNFLSSAAITPLALKWLLLATLIAPPPPQRSLSLVPLFAIPFMSFRLSGGAISLW